MLAVGDGGAPAGDGEAPKGSEAQQNRRAVNRELEGVQRRAEQLARQAQQVPTPPKAHLCQQIQTPKGVCNMRDYAYVICNIRLGFKQQHRDHKNRKQNSQFVFRSQFHEVA